MKKSIAVILLGSALLLPNNNNVEASYSGNDVQVQKVQVQKVQYVQYFGLGDFQFNFNESELGKRLLKELRYNLENPYAKYKEVSVPNPVIPAAKPAPAPAAKPAPAPAAKPAPAPAAKPAPAPAAKPAQDASISAVEKAVLDLTNVERQKAGLKPLLTDSKLMNSARAKSADMASKNYFSHTSPTYGSPFDQMKAFGVTYSSAAENIAMGQRTAQEVVKGWMESPGHRENIMNPSLTHIGIGYDQNGNYWTQQFIGK